MGLKSSSLVLTVVQRGVVSCKKLAESKRLTCAEAELGWEERQNVGPGVTLLTPDQECDHNDEDHDDKDHDDEDHNDEDHDSPPV